MPSLIAGTFQARLVSYFQHSQQPLFLQQRSIPHRHGLDRLLTSFFFGHSKALLSAPQWARLLHHRQFEYKSSSIAFKPFYEDIDPAPVQNVILQDNAER
jgi:hypothetical protein